MDAPLSGVRVLDLSRLLPGPYATMILGDLGAAVDKLEDPRGGDYLRAMPPHTGGMSTAFQILNRNKRSVVVDLKTDGGRELFVRLIRNYDVLLETFRPGVMDRIGLGYSALREVHPGLIYCAISGYGETGPLADRAGHDLNYIGRAGVLGLTGPGDRPPQPPGVQLADLAGGALFAVVNILAALHARGRTGQGTKLDVSMCEGSLALSLYGLSLLGGGTLRGRGGDSLMGGIAPYNTYETKDGKYVTVAPLEPKFFQAFCAGVGLNPDFQVLMPGPHQEEWKRVFAAKIKERTRDEWTAFGAQHDCCVEPVLELPEVINDAQHRARDVFFDVPLPGGERVRMFRTPVGKPGAVRPAPRAGEHTQAVLEDAGYSAAEIEALRRDAVIA